MFIYLFLLLSLEFSLAVLLFFPVTLLSLGTNFLNSFDLVPIVLFQISKKPFLTWDFLLQAPQLILQIQNLLLLFFNQIVNVFLVLLLLDSTLQGRYLVLYLLELSFIGRSFKLVIHKFQLT